LISVDKISRFHQESHKNNTGVTHDASLEHEKDGKRGKQKGRAGDYEIKNKSNT